MSIYRSNQIKLPVDMPTLHYLFTLNNYTEDELNTITTTTYRDCNYLCFAPEVGEKGTPHLQGYIQVTKQIQWKTIKNTWPGFSRAHFETAFGSSEDNVTYCKGPYDKEVKGVRKVKPLNQDFWEYGQCRDIGKRGKRTDLDAVKRDIQEGKSYDEICETHFEVAAKYSRFIKERIQARDTIMVQSSLLKDYEGSSLKPWQQELVDVVEANAHPRKIYWIWSEEGNLGKSYMATYLGVKHKACVFMGGAKTNLAFIYAQNPTKLVVFDLSRTQEANYMDHLYSLAEDLKNGRLTSTKYESKTIYFPIPHVIFLANFAPDLTKWSEDRYDIKHL